MTSKWEFLFVGALVGCSLIVASMFDGPAIQSKQTTPTIQTVDLGAIILSTVFWTTHDFDVDLPAGVKSGIRVTQPCCTKAEILSQKGSHLRFRVSGKLNPNEGPKRWVVELIGESKRVLTTVVMAAHAVPAMAFVDDPMSAGVRVKDQPEKWQTRLEIHSSKPHGPLQPPVVRSGNPQVEIGKPESLQTGNLHTLVYPVSFTFRPESPGLHEASVRITIPETSYTTTARFAWYETRDKN